MKRTILRYIAGFIPLIAIFGSACAQTVNLEVASGELPAKKYVFNEMKAEEAVWIASIADINARALKEFSKTFKTVTDASWYEMTDGKGYVAKFKQDGIETRVNYDRKGRWTATILTYTEAHLPRDIRHMVKRNYYDYTIFLVQEVHVGDKTAYLVKIEDEKTFKTIRVVDGEMDEYESYNKG
jgi:hypothetical protein